MRVLILFVVSVFSLRYNILYSGTTLFNGDSLCEANLSTCGNSTEMYCLRVIYHNNTICELQHGSDNITLIAVQTSYCLLNFIKGRLFIPETDWEIKPLVNIEIDATFVILNTRECSWTRSCLQFVYETGLIKRFSL